MHQHWLTVVLGMHYIYVHIVITILKFIRNSDKCNYYSRAIHLIFILYMYMHENEYRRSFYSFIQIDIDMFILLFSYKSTTNILTLQSMEYIQRCGLVIVFPQQRKKYAYICHEEIIKQLFNVLSDMKTKTFPTVMETAQCDVLLPLAFFVGQKQASAFQEIMC